MGATTASGMTTVILLSTASFSVCAITMSCISAMTVVSFRAIFFTTAIATRATLVFPFLYRQGEDEDRLGRVRPHIRQIRHGGRVAAPYDELRRADRRYLAPDSSPSSTLSSGLRITNTGGLAW